MTRSISRRSGFTLIEILIVIAIISILSSVAIVGLPKIGGKGRDARRVSDMRQVQTALELYFTKNGNYPNVSTWTALNNELIDPTRGVGISGIPNDPRNATPYLYTYAVASPGLSSYVLKAVLEDTSNPALNGDLDGTILTVDCADPAYCVSL